MDNDEIKEKYGLATEYHKVTKREFEEAIGDGGIEGIVEQLNSETKKFFEITDKMLDEARADERAKIIKDDKCGTTSVYNRKSLANIEEEIRASERAKAYAEVRKIIEDEIKDNDSSEYGRDKEGSANTQYSIEQLLKRLLSQLPDVKVKE